MWNRWLRVAMALTLTIPASAALADDAPPAAVAGMDDEVTLKDGGTLRGVIISVEPGKEVKILLLGDKDPRVIPWSQVADVQKGKYAPKTTAEPGSAGDGYKEPAPKKVAKKTAKPREPDEDPEPPMRPNRRKVHINSPEPATLMHVAGMGSGVVNGQAFVIAAVEPVCTSPCDEEVTIESGDSYYVDGSFPSTGLISFYGSDNVVDVKPGSTGRRIGGWLTLSLSGGALAAGAAILTIDAISCSVGCTAEEANDIGPRAGGGTLVALGIAGVVGGIVLIATSGSSATVHSEDSPSVSLWVGGSEASEGRVSPLPSVVGVAGSF